MLSHAVCTVVGYDITKPPLTAHIRTVADAFKKAIGAVHHQALDYSQAMMLRENSNRLVQLVNSDPTDWSWESFKAGLDAGSTWMEPSVPGQVPTAEVPIWTRTILLTCINTGELVHLETGAASVWRRGCVVSLESKHSCRFGSACSFFARRSHLKKGGGRKKRSGHSASWRSEREVDRRGEIRV